MNARLDFWNRLDDYEGSIISLYHRPGGEELRRRIAALITPETVAADLGCGHGYFLSELAAAKRLFAVDYAEKSLAAARERAPASTQFLHQHLAQLHLPEPLDLALCFSTLMPENHTQALRLLERLSAAIRPGGHLLLVLPAMESRLYVSNLIHFQAARLGREKESLAARMSEFVSGFNNPLGYVRSRDGQVLKYWIAEELERQLQATGRVAGVERFKVDIEWRDYAREAAWQSDAEPPWFWGWQVRMK